MGRWAQFGTGLGAVATAATIFFGGFAMGDNAGEEVKELLEKTNLSLEKANKNLEAERNALKTELARVQTVNSSKPAEKAADAPEMPAPALAERGVKITIQPGETAEAFSGALLISLVGISVGYDPVRYEVTANVGMPGKDNLEIKGAVSGYRALYGGFEIRLLSADLSTATFQIQKLGTEEPIDPNPLTTP